MKLVYPFMSNKIYILFSNTVAVQVVLWGPEWELKGKKVKQYVGKTEENVLSAFQLWEEI